jgi:phage tail-like protein
VRVIVMDEDGRTPVMTYELTNCIPKSFEQETLTAGGNNAAYFKFSVRPEDMEVE